MERVSFIFYKDWKDAIKDLPDNVRLELYECIMEYAFTGKVKRLKPTVSIAFNFIKTSMDRNSEKYEKVIERRREAGRKGGLTKKQNEAKETPETTVANVASASKPKQKKQVLASASKCKQKKQTVANVAVNGNGNVNGNVNGNGNDNESPKGDILELAIANTSESTDSPIPPAKSDFEKFNSWLVDNAPNVMKLKTQITEAQFTKLKAIYDTDRMTDILCRMDNYKDLTKKYVSVYQTFLNWAKREYGNS